MDGSENETSVNSTAAPEMNEKQTQKRFIGSFNHSLDSKGRLVIPQGFRDKLGETFCVAPSFDFRSIAIYPTEKWEERNKTYERLGKLNPALNRYLEQFYALSFDEQTCDAQGRVLLPANIRQKILQGGHGQLKGQGLPLEIGEGHCPGEAALQLPDIGVDMLGDEIDDLVGHMDIVKAGLVS